MTATHFIDPLFGLAAAGYRDCPIRRSQPIGATLLLLRRGSSCTSRQEAHMRCQQVIVRLAASVEVNVVIRDHAVARFESLRFESDISDCIDIAELLRLVVGNRSDGPVARLCSEGARMMLFTCTSWAMEVTGPNCHAATWHR